MKKKIVMYPPREKSFDNIGVYGTHITTLECDGV